MTREAGGTIVAIATPAGPGLRGMLRVSGPLAWPLVESVWAGAEPLSDPGPRAVFVGRLDDGVGEQPLTVFWMRGPRSFTREDVAELHLPGSPPLLARALARLVELGARLARPGEFTRRAFENGRIDLTRAEGILEIISAKNESDVRSARALLFGGLGRRVAALRDGLEGLRFLCEATLDFDHEDTLEIPDEELLRRGGEVFAALGEAERWESRRLPAAGLPRVALVGEANAGKSSLFNALVEGAEALVSDLAGTTRDVVTGTWELPGGTVLLSDTAGLDPTATGPDAVAQEFGEERHRTADLLLWVADAARAVDAEPPRPPTDEGVAPVLLAWNKSDLPGAAAEPPPGSCRSWVATSATERRGLEELGRRTASLLSLTEPFAGAAPNAPAPRQGRELSARHRAALRAAREALERGLDAWRSGAALDMLAEHLREATAALDGISGRTTPEDLLDRIFAGFCLGK